MIIRNCIKCKEYKYIKKDGYCRACLNEDTISKLAKSSSGSLKHRFLIKKSNEYFMKLNFMINITSPKNKKSDIIAKNPLKNKSLHNINKPIHKDIYKHFGTKDININIEISTVVRKNHIVNKLNKAHANNRYCLFIVQDGLSNKNNFTYWAELLENTISMSSSSINTNEWSTLIYCTKDNEFKLYENKKVNKLELNKYI